MRKEGDATAIALLRWRASELLDLAGAEVQSRRLRETPCNPANRYACLFKTCSAVEVSLRVRWGLVMIAPGSREAAAVEAVDLVRLGATASLTSADPEGAWILTLVERVEGRIRRLGSVPELVNPRRTVDGEGVE